MTNPITIDPSKNSAAVAALINLLWASLDGNSIQCAKPWPFDSDGLDFTHEGAVTIAVDGSGAVQFTFRATPQSPKLSGTLDLALLEEQLVKIANAEIHLIANANAMTLTTESVFYQIDAANTWANDDTPAGMAISDTGTITCETAGRFFMIATLSIITAAGAQESLKFQMFKNGSPIPSHSGDQWIYNALYPNNVTLSGSDDLQVGDVIDLRVECTTAAGITITIVDANFCMFAIA